jgi:hypothetical protein
MALGFYKQYKPTRLSDDTWDRYMAEAMQGGLLDPRTYNSWYCNRVRSKVLDKLLAEERIGKVSRRTQRYARKSGLDADDKKLDLLSSILGWGKLHYGTEYGFHREEAHTPRGTKWEGVASSLIILMMFGRELNTGGGGFGSTEPPLGHFQIDGKTFNGWCQHDVKSAVFSIICEAEARGDAVSLMVSPRYIEEEIEKEYPGNRTRNIIWGKPFEHKQYRRDNTVAVTRRNIDPSQSLWNCRIPGSSFNYEEIRNKRHAVDQGIQEEISAYNSSWESGVPHNYNRRQVATTGDGKPCYRSFISPPIFLNSQRYGEIKDFILKMPTMDDNGALSWPHQAFPMLQVIWKTIPKVKRSKIFIIGAISYPYSWAMSWKIFEMLERGADIFVFDLNPDYDMTEYFFGKACATDKNYTPCKINQNGEETEPLLVKSGKRLFKYIWIPNPLELTEAVLRAMKGAN